MKFTNSQKRRLSVLQVKARNLGREIDVGVTAIFIKNPSAGSFYPCDSLTHVASVLRGIK